MYVIGYVVIYNKKKLTHALHGVEDKGKRFVLLDKDNETVGYLFFFLPMDLTVRPDVDNIVTLRMEGLRFIFM
jgi:hypothetical protein